MYNHEPVPLSGDVRAPKLTTIATKSPANLETSLAEEVKNCSGDCTRFPPLKMSSQSKIYK